MGVDFFMSLLAMITPSSLGYCGDYMNWQVQELKVGAGGSKCPRSFLPQLSPPSPPSLLPPLIFLPASTPTCNPCPHFLFPPSKANRHLPGQLCFMKTRKSNSQLPGGFASQGETLTPTLLSTELSHLWGSYRPFSPQSLKCWQLSQLQGTGEYAKAQRGDVTCPRSHSLELRELGLSYPRTSVLGPGAVLGKG